MSKPFNPRKFWLPRRPELPEQCASCPFREDNEAEFGLIATRLFKSAGKKKPPTADQIRQVRHNVHMDCQDRGEFICHGTAYNEDMTLKDPKGHRQCPGASKFYRDSYRPAK